MKKKISYLITFVFLLFIFIIDVKAETGTVEFVCEYKLGTSIAKLSLSYNLSRTDDYKTDYTLIYNSKSGKTYPANDINIDSNQYQASGGAGYIKDNYQMPACPASIFITFQNGVVLEKSVVYDYNWNNPENTKIVFFSNEGYLIENNKLTDTKLNFEVLGIFNNYLTKDSFSNSVEIKEFKLNKNSSTTIDVPKPEESDEKLQYCYYKNACGKVLELAFYKNANINERKFNNGYKLMKWDNDKKNCPTSIDYKDEKYYGSYASCETSGDQNKCFSFLESSTTKKENMISEGKCKNTSYEKGGIIYRNMKDSNKEIRVNFTNSDVSSERFKITKGTKTINNEIITISNQESYVSNFSSKNKDEYPPYIIIISENGSLKYMFTDNPNSHGASESNTYILLSKIFDLSDLPTSDVILSCKELFGESFFGFLKRNVYIPFVIAIPILLIVLTTIDFAKVVFSEDKEGIKKAGTKFGKRAIMAVIILLVPTILIFIADTIGVDEVQECAKLIKSYSNGETS